MVQGPCSHHKYLPGNATKALTFAVGKSTDVYRSWQPCGFRDQNAPAWASLQKPFPCGTRQVSYQRLRVDCMSLTPTPIITRMLSVSLAFRGAYMESSLFSFVECLCALPNLHTFEIVYCLSGKLPAGIKRAFTAINLPTIRTLTVHSRAGSVIKACPNVKEVTLICGGFNIPDSVIELLADMQHTIRRVAVLHGNSEGISKLFLPSKAYLIHYILNTVSSKTSGTLSYA